MPASTASAEHAADFDEYDLDDYLIPARTYQRGSFILHLSYSFTTRCISRLAGPASTHASSYSAGDTAPQATV